MVCTLIVAAVLSANVFDVESKFDTGLEGWTLQGPGLLDWVSTPGTGGHLKVTRTGPGEVYLVAPSPFHGDWRTHGGLGNVSRVTVGWRPATSASRPFVVEISGPGGTLQRSESAIGISGNTWNPMSVRAFGELPPPETVTGLKIRLGTDAALPIGEVMLIDNIGVQSCGANLDGSTGSPLLTANDFMAFINAWAGGSPRANYDGYTQPSASDFQAFMDWFAVGCNSR